MRLSDFRSKIQLDKKTIKYTLISAAAVILAGVIFFFAYFHVSTVEVAGSDHYTEDEIKEMILNGPFASNSVLAPMLYSQSEVEDITYVKSAKVTRTSHNSLMISIKESPAVGCVPYLDSYIYFDRDGIFVEGTTERDESIPFFDGITIENAVLNEKLPIKDTVLNTAVALSTIFSKNDTVPDHIEFDDNNEIKLIYGDITVNLGKDEYLEDKMTRALAILPKLSGQKGILHLENLTGTSKKITFESEEDIVKDPVIWYGGYDEEGDYIGDEGEYDEDGNYVGEKPEGAVSANEVSYDGDSDTDYSEDDYYEDDYYEDDYYDDSYYDDYEEDYYDDSYYDEEY